MIVLSRIVRIDVIVGRDTDSFSVSTNSNNRCCCHLTSIRTYCVLESIIQHFTHLLNLYRLCKGNNEVTTTSKINTLAQATYTKAYNTYYNSNTPYRKALLIHTHELVVLTLHKVLRNTCPELEVLPFSLIQLVFINNTCYIYSCEDVTANTDNPCCSEALNRTCSEGVQNDTSEKRCKVRVDNSRESVAETSINSLLHALSGTKFLFNTLVNKYVGIDTCTQREYHTSNTTHGKSGLERCKNTKSEEYVKQQSTNSNCARNDVVHNKHEDNKQYKGDGKRNNALLN